MKAVVSVIGKDKVGIISHVTSELAKLKINVEEISQTIMQEHFTMMMMVDLSKCKDDMKTISTALETAGSKIGVNIKIQHIDIFNAMHKI